MTGNLLSKATGAGNEEKQVPAHLALVRLQKVGGALVDWALVYAGLGLPVFACPPATKRPLTDHGFKAATAEAEKIRAFWKRWPKAAIGMPTGHASGLLVADINAKSEQETLRRWWSEYPPRFGDQIVRP